jgi:hypothetical protein
VAVAQLAQSIITSRPAPPARRRRRSSPGRSASRSASRVPPCLPALTGSQTW